jgi:hypothetical protein
LIQEKLLKKDYFITTGTMRPLSCFAKILPVDQAHSDCISLQLRHYVIELADYLESSKIIGIRAPTQLSRIGHELLSHHPYVAIFGLHTAFKSLNKASTNDTNIKYDVWCERNATKTTSCSANPSVVSFASSNHV